MNRTEAQQLTWIAVTKRLPPDTETKVECWNYIFAEPFVMEAWIARLGIKKAMDGGETSPDRRISHWRPIVGPSMKRE